MHGALSHAQVGDRAGDRVQQRLLVEKREKKWKAVESGTVTGLGRKDRVEVDRSLGQVRLAGPDSAPEGSTRLWLCQLCQTWEAWPNLPKGHA